MATLNAADDTIPNHLKYQAAICFSFSVLCTTTASKISPGAYLVYMAGCGAASAFFFVLTLCRILKGRTAQNAVRPVAVTMGQVEQPSLAVMAESTTVEGLGATYISIPSSLWHRLADVIQDMGNHHPNFRGTEAGADLDVLGNAIKYCWPGSGESLGLRQRELLEKAEAVIEKRGGARIGRHPVERCIETAETLLGLWSD